MPKIELSEDGKHYLIHGLEPAPELMAQIAHRIGPTEAAVEIPQALVFDFLRERRSFRGRMRRLLAWVRRKRR